MVGRPSLWIYHDTVGEYVQRIATINAKSEGVVAHQTLEFVRHGAHHLRWNGQQLYFLRTQITDLMTDK